MSLPDERAPLDDDRLVLGSRYDRKPLVEAGEAEILAMIVCRTVQG